MSLLKGICPYCKNEVVLMSNPNNPPQEVRRTKPDNFLLAHHQATDNYPLWCEGTLQPPIQIKA